jgi:hypothetical protein
MLSGLVPQADRLPKYESVVNTVVALIENTYNQLRNSLMVRDDEVVQVIH